MASVKRGVLVKAGEWARHLRSWGKRHFWRRHRMAEKAEAKKDVGER